MSDGTAPGGGLGDGDRLHDGPDDDALPSRRPAGSMHAIGQIARGAASQARATSSTGLRRVGQVVEERTGVVDFARHRPLLAIGAAFTVGFVAAYVTERKEGNPHVERVRRRARALLLANVAAATAAILPSLTGEGGIIEVVSGWLQDDGDEFDA